MFRKYKTFYIIYIVLFFFNSMFAEGLESLLIHGYGSVGGAYQKNHNILYRNSLNTDNGSRGNFSFETDSKMGLQLDIEPVEKLTFTLQGLASQNNANNKFLSVEWANLKYKFSDEFDIRVGKMQLPAFMYSDVINLAYAYDWIRLPDMYSTIPFHSYRGVELNYNTDYEYFSIDLKLMHGKENDSIKIKEANTDVFKDSKVEVNDLYGIVLGISIEELKLRFAYTKFDFTLKNKQVDELLAQFNSLGIPVITSSIDKYKINHTPSSYIEFGISYDFENAYILGEYMRLDSDSFKSDTNSWYISTGYHFEQLTPFITYSKTTSKSNYKDINIPIGSPPPVAGVIIGANAAYANFTSKTKIDQDTTSLGVRYDLSDNLALKIQYDYVQEKKESSSVFVHFNNEPQTDLHVFSATINYVF